MIFWQTFVIGIWVIAMVECIAPRLAHYEARRLQRQTEEEGGLCESWRIDYWAKEREALTKNRAKGVKITLIGLAVLGITAAFSKIAPFSSWVLIIAILSGLTPTLLGGLEIVLAFWCYPQFKVELPK